MIIATFLVFAALMMSRRLPALLALPFMAVLIGLISGISFNWTRLPATFAGPHNLYEFICNFILTQGSIKLSLAMAYAIFGSILSQVVLRTGIAKRLISLAAEYAGDRKLLLSFFMTALTAACFTSVTGLGAVIMLGSLALPIMIGTGTTAEFAAGALLFAIALGGIFNPAILGFYQNTLKLPLDTVKQYVIAYGSLLGLTTLAYLIYYGTKQQHVHNWAVKKDLQELTQSIPKVAAPALLTPVLPVLMILIFGLPIIPAFILSILYGCLTTNPRRWLHNLTASILEGIKDIAPVIGLFIGIGMALNAMMAQPTKEIMTPLLQSVVPQTKATYLLFFSLLAPLALYRGPLNFYGLGAGIAGLLLGSGLMSPVAILAAFFAVGQIQGVCDPTNTHNVWIAGFTKVPVEKLLRLTLPFVWIFVALALCYAVFFQGVMS